MKRLDQKEVARILRVARRKKVLADKGLKFSDIADKGHVSKVINEKVRYPKLRRKIARKAGISYRVFWKDAL